MTAEINKVSRRILRIHVEPIEIELDEDDSAILLPTLQTAFPHCSGLFYFDPKTNIKKIVKYDGKQFFAPQGDWNTETIFANLSGTRLISPTRNNNNIQGNYETATKTFERSVSAVQKMFDAINGNKLGTAKQDKLYKHKPLESEMEEKTNIIKLEPMLAMLSKQVINDSKFANNNSTLDANRHNCRNDLNDNIKINQNDLSYKQLEHQFLDLAKISNGKDIIIEGQRKELSESNEKLTSLTKLFNNAKDELLLTKDKVMAIEKELDIFVELGKDQKDLENLLQEERKKLEHEICKNESLLKNIANLESENLALKTELTRTSQKFSELEFLINNLGRDKRSLKIELEETCDQLTQKCKDLNALNEELAHDNITLIEREQKAITQLEQITKDQYEQRDHWDEVLQKNETQISELTSSLFNAKNEFNNLVDINDELSRRCLGAQLEAKHVNEMYEMLKIKEKSTMNRNIRNGSVAALRF